jgi:hypothetical protein
VNRVSIRDALIQHMQDNWTHANEVPVFYQREQSTIDLTSVGAWFMKASIIFLTNQQANIGNQDTSFQRTSGNMEIVLLYKEGESDRVADGYLDEITNFFKLRVLSTGLHIRVPTPGRHVENSGWCSDTLLIPFFADSNS